jgi:hypothetical protein
MTTNSTKKTTYRSQWVDLDSNISIKYVDSNNQENWIPFHSQPKKENTGFHVYCRYSWFLKEFCINATWSDTMIPKYRFYVKAKDIKTAFKTFYRITRIMSKFTE